MENAYIRLLAIKYDISLSKRNIKWNNIVVPYKRNFNHDCFLSSIQITMQYFYKSAIFYIHIYIYNMGIII